MRRIARAAAAHEGDLERRVEEVGNALLVAFGGGAQQPHEQEEGHHRRHEVGIGNLPGAAVMAMPAAADALDDDGLELLGITGHGLWSYDGFFFTTENTEDTEDT